MEGRNSMAATSVAPELNSPVDDEPVRVDEPKPVGGKRRVRDLLVAIFQGHEEFLGWTPD
jgi:hypothetical protein